MIYIVVLRLQGTRKGVCVPDTSRLWICEHHSFSRLDARFAHYVNEAGRRPAFPITFILSPIKELEVEKHIDILQEIVTSRRKPWPPADKHCKIIDFTKCSEQEIFLEICRTFYALLQQRYK